MKDFQPVINKLINKSVVGCDTYTNKNSLWLIFTDKKEWVIELTSTGSLWYNYYFFQKIFKVLGLDVIENQGYITKWVEDNVINGVKKTLWISTEREKLADITIQNGIKHTENGDWDDGDWLDDILQEGVKDTFPNSESDSSVDVEDTIQNGVRDTQSNPYANESWIKGVIKNGVKETRLEENITEGEIEGIIEEGVKSSNPRQYVLTQLIENIIKDGDISTYEDAYHHTHRVEGVIKNGVKETKKLNEVVVDWIGDIIENGVKEIKPLPSQTGNKDWSEYSHGREDRTKPFNEYLNDTLEEGVKIN
jgi:hypothetical protein